MALLPLPIAPKPNLLQQATSGGPKTNILQQAEGKAAPTVYPSPNKSFVPNGIKATAPGATNQGIVNSLPSQYKAPPVQQTTVSNQGVLPGNSGQSSVPNMQPAQTQIYAGDNTVNPVNPQPAQPPVQSFGGIIGQLVQKSTQPSEEVTNAQTALQQAIQNQQKLESGIAGQYGNIESQAIPLEFQQGREQALSRQYASQEQAAQNAVTQQQTAVGQAITGQGQQLGGLQSAAGATATQFAAPGMSAYVPLNPGESTGGLSPEVMQSYAQMAVNGQLSAIPSSITGNPVLNDQLNQLAKQIDPKYNPVLSQASGTTQAQGQQLQTQATAANSALDTLQQQFNQLGQYSGGTGIKPLNQVEQTIGSFVGNPANSQYQTTLQEARAKVAGVLSSSGGITPTNAEQMAMDYLPDGMTPNELPAKIQAAKTLISQTVNSFVGSGQQPSQNNASSNSNTSGDFNW